MTFEGIRHRRNGVLLTSISLCRSYLRYWKVCRGLVATITLWIEIEFIELNWASTEVDEFMRKLVIGEKY